jgi:hypothetical protein
MGLFKDGVLNGDGGGGGDDDVRVFLCFRLTCPVYEK